MQSINTETHASAAFVCIDYRMRAYSNFIIVVRNVPSVGANSTLDNSVLLVIWTIQVPVHIRIIVSCGSIYSQAITHDVRHHQINLSIRKRARKQDKTQYGITIKKNIYCYL